MDTESNPTPPATQKMHTSHLTFFWRYVCRVEGVYGDTEERDRGTQGGYEGDSSQPSPTQAALIQCLFLQSSGARQPHPSRLEG